MPSVNSFITTSTTMSTFSATACKHVQPTIIFKILLVTYGINRSTNQQLQWCRGLKKQARRKLQFSYGNYANFGQNLIRKLKIYDKEDYECSKLFQFCPYTSPKWGLSARNFQQKKFSDYFLTA